MADKQRRWRKCTWYPWQREKRWQPYALKVMEIHVVPLTERDKMAAIHTGGDGKSRGAPDRERQETVIHWR